MRLILVRHGETAENAGDIHMGQADRPLNAVGHAQAAKVAQRLRDERIDVAYASDLMRARATAEAILAFHPHLALHLDRRLREKDAGIFNGRPRAELHAAYEAANDFPHFRPQDGESFHDLQTRAKTFYAFLLKHHPHDDVLVVSHGGFITTLLLHLHQKPLVLEEYRKVHPGNTAVTILEIESEGTRCVHVLNSTEHLA